MSGPADCKILGRWRIVEADLWDGSYLNLAGPATLTIGNDGQGEMALGAMQASLDLQYGRSIVFFRWGGSDEGDEVTGSGSAELNDDGTLEIELSYDNDDEVTLKARRS